MIFLKKKYKAWSLPWLAQRPVLLLKERRLPQFGLRNRIRKLYPLPVPPSENFSPPQFVPKTVPGKGFMPLNPESDTELKSATLAVLPPRGTSEKHAVNRYFDKVFVISLRNRPDRRLQTIQKLRRLGIEAEIFYADNGYDEENLKEYNDYASAPIGGIRAHRLERIYRKKMIISPGAWGYLKTYKRLLRYSIRMGYGRILCFDDDVIFHRDFNRLFEEKTREIPGTWKLLYLGATQHNWDVVDRDENNISMRAAAIGEPGYYHPRHTDGSYAIGIDHSVFPLLLNEISKMNCSFDTGALRTVNYKFPREVFVFLPNLVIADVSESDIGNGRDQSVFAEKMRWDMARYDHPFSYDLVSVVMPAFNAEKTIERSIRSILGQSYPNIELIVVDDGSTDGTPRIAERLAKEDDRVRFIRQETNRGCYFSRNLGIRLARGKYIANHDADDIALQHRIERQMIPLSCGQAEITIAHVFRSRCPAEQLVRLDEDELIGTVLGLRQTDKQGKYCYRDRPVLGLMTSLFRKGLFEEFGLFWESRFGADSEYLERVLHRMDKLPVGEKDPSVQSRLSRLDHIAGTYKRINEVLVVSPALNGNNITGSYCADERDEFMLTWRRRLAGQGDYIYPKLTDNQSGSR